MRHLLWLLICGLLHTHSAYSKNVILFIVDGMGVNWVSLARIVKQVEKTGPLFLDSAPATALIRTNSADNWVTDSAASATAYATGQKTNNGVVSMDSSAQPPKSAGGKYEKEKAGLPLVSIVTLAKKKGYGVGVISDTRVTHSRHARGFLCPSS